MKITRSRRGRRARPALERAVVSPGERQAEGSFPADSRGWWLRVRTRLTIF